MKSLSEIANSQEQHVRQYKAKPYAIYSDLTTFIAAKSPR